MVGSHKILTVSYGTFSCTLEGFDDSFGTMKAIAEYFRDLAAEDRYFGAEPPTPDAEMLARIAEREIARRVEARVEGSGVVLRVGQDRPAPQRQAPEPDAATGEIADPAVFPASAARAMPQPHAAPEFSAKAEAVAPAQPRDPQSRPAGESIAAKLERIRAVVGRQSAPEAESADFEGDEAETQILPMMEAEATARHQLDLDQTDSRLEIRAETEAEDEEIITLSPSATVAAGFEPADEAVAHAVASDPAPLRTPQPQPQPTGATPPRPRVIRMRRADLERAMRDGSIILPGAAGAAAAAQPEPTVVGANVAQDPATVAPAPIAASVDTAPLAPIQPDVPAVAEQAGPDLAKVLAPAAPQASVRTKPKAAPVSTLSPEDEADLMAELAALRALDGEIDETFEDEDRELAELEEAFNTAPAEADVTAPLAVEDHAEAEQPDVDDFDFEDVEIPLEATTEEEWQADQDEAPATGTDDLIAELPEDEVPEDEVRADASDLQAGETTDRFDLAAFSAALGAANADETEEDWAHQDVADEDMAQDDLTDQDLAGQGLPQTDWADEAAENAQGNEADAPVALAEAFEVEATGAIEESDLDLSALLRLDGLDSATPGDAAAEEVAEADEDIFAAYLEENDRISDQGTASNDLPAVRQDGGTSLRLRRQPSADDADMTRIMERTEQDLSDPAARGRREALASLKAAVAATEAARRLGEEPGDGDEVVNAFREDLRQVVKPRRPVMPGQSARDGQPAAATERPRPAPLKLVASQRVDLPRASEASAPIRPRRVAAPRPPVAEGADGTVATAPRNSGFARFVEEMGAHQLHDLLEAAAAYTAFVEGIEDFSRPQLMRKLAAYGSDRFSREDQLRTFGTLLRDGRIIRADVVGRFHIPADSRFNPERRAV